MILQCDYVNIGLPCKGCAQKGLDCGAEQKVFARESKCLDTTPSEGLIALLDTEFTDDIQTIECIPRRLLTPHDEILPSSDGVYMEFYWCTSGMWFDLVNDSTNSGTHPLAMCAAHRFGMHIGSNVVRSALLFYSSCRKERKLSYLGMQYLALFYDCAREAISHESYVELVYACYVMCLSEMTCGRKLFGDFVKHANGFMISFENLVNMDALTTEEKQVLGQAYDLLVQTTRIASSTWHQDETWFDFTKTITQRLDSAASRSLIQNNSTSPSTNESVVWIPKSHHLAGAEEVVARLGTLFDVLSMIIRHEITEYNVDWLDTVAAVARSLDELGQIIFSPPPPQYIYSEFPTIFLLKDGVTTLPGDKFMQQVLTLYYIFLLQYYLVVGEWLDSTRLEVIETAYAIRRLFPAPHESHYPGRKVRFIANRGFFFAHIVSAESQNIGGKSSFMLWS